MAEHLPSGPAELGAPMDYAEHERTFAGFVAFTQIAVLATVDIMIALLLYAFGSGGFWLGTLLVVLTSIAAIMALAAKGTAKPLIVTTIIGLVFFVISVA